jgi:HlyD family secretion protein
MKMTKSRAVLGIAVAAGATLLGYSFMPKPVEVETVRSARSSIVQTIDEEAETRVRERYDIAAPIPGASTRITVHAGDAVREGDVVATIVPSSIDPRQLKQLQSRLRASEESVRVAEAMLHRAEATKRQADRELTRMEKLAKEAIVSKESTDRVRTAATEAARELDAARFRLESSHFEKEIARAALVSSNEGDAIFTIRAPVSGRVLRVAKESESVVVPGTLLLQIGDPQSLEIVIPLLSTDAVNVRPGSEVIVDEWGGNHPLRARVRMIEPSGFKKVSALGVEEQRVNVIADFVGEVPVADGYRVRTRIVTWRGDGVTVPATALFRRGDSWAAYVVNKGRARVQKIVTGQLCVSSVVISSGRNVGADVVFHPSDRVRDNVRVRVLRGR